MKKYLLTVILGIAIVLGACGEGNTDSAESIEPNEAATETSGSESAEVGETAEETVEEVTAEVSIETAEAGDVVESDIGTYEIVKVAENVGSYESGPVTYIVDRAYLAKFTPNDSEAFLFENEPNVDGTIHVLVTIVTAENSGEEYVSFSPFNAEAFVGGSKPYRGQAYLNEGESEISAGKSEEFVTAYNLEDEDIAEVSEVSVNQSGPAADSMRIGDDVEYTINFE